MTKIDRHFLLLYEVICFTLYTREIARNHLLYFLACKCVIYFRMTYLNTTVSWWPTWPVELMPTFLVWWGLGWNGDGLQLGWQGSRHSQLHEQLFFLRIQWMSKTLILLSILFQTEMPLCTLGRVNLQKKFCTMVKIEFLVQKMPPKSGGVLRPIFPLLNLGNRAVPNS